MTSAPSPTAPSVSDDFVQIVVLSGPNDRKLVSQSFPKRDTPQTLKAVLFFLENLDLGFTLPDDLSDGAVEISGQLQATEPPVPLLTDEQLTSFYEAIEMEEFRHRARLFVKLDFDVIDDNGTTPSPLFRLTSAVSGAFSRVGSSRLLRRNSSSLSSGSGTTPRSTVSHPFASAPELGALLRSGLYTPRYIRKQIQDLVNCLTNSITNNFHL